MSKVLKGKVVLVTGGSGSIGSEIVNQALIQGANKVVVLSRDEAKHFMMRKKFSNDRLETIVGDVKDARSVEQIFTNLDIDVIYHAAAMKHVVMCEEFPLESAYTNIIGTQNVVDMALKYCIPKMITISTDKAAFPSNVMGACKFIAERVTVNANKKSKKQQFFSCVRFGNVANSRGSVIPVYIEDLLNRKPIQVTNREVTRFIMEIGEAVRLVIKATEYTQGGEIFILKMKAFKLGDLVDVMRNRIASRLHISKKDIEIHESGLVIGEKKHEDLISHDELSRLYEFKDMYVLLADNRLSTSYPLISKSNLLKYSSADVELVLKDDLEKIVLKYLKERSLVT
jgi:FlaA1/EpsC-like NDP-sugar epimerase